MSIAFATVNTGTFDFLCNFVREKSAIVLEPSKVYLVESRLNPVARENGMSSLDELVAALKKPTSRELARQVIDAMTTNESSFFRDLQPFEALKSVIIPELMEKRSKERTLNIWSNACSSGQKIFSIAMLLRDNFPALGGWKVRLIASDLSTAILNKAHRILRPDGCLFLGGAETTMNLDTKFERSSVGKTTCYRPNSTGG